jgi:hypothetical protein
VSKIITYQDLEKCGDDEQALCSFVQKTIDEYKGSDLYKTAVLSNEYVRRRNRTIVRFRKLLFTVTGKRVDDIFSANFKLPNGIFGRLISQETNFLLGNGVTWKDKDAAESKLGKDFDAKLASIGADALGGAVGFGFYNKDHVEAWSAREFVPLWDEETSALRAGIRFWQISADKPLRAILFRETGYTEFIKAVNGTMKMQTPERPYKTRTLGADIDTEKQTVGENYDGLLPIVPMWGNKLHQSELIGLRQQIDCYDLIKSGYANNVDEGSIIYWTLENAGYSDDVDLAKFVEKIKTVHAAVTEGNAKAHTLEAPYESREAILKTLKNDIYEDFGAVDVKQIAGGAVTATQIEAAYEPLNEKADGFEFCVLEFLQGIMRLAGIENESPTFTRSMIININETVQTLVTGGNYLHPEYITTKIMTLLGDGDKAEEWIKKMNADEFERLGGDDE